MYTPNKQKKRRGLVFRSAFNAKHDLQNDFIELPDIPVDKGEKQNAAKQLLIQLGDNDPLSSPHTFRRNCPTIDGWTNPLNQISHRNQEQGNRVSNHTFSRTTYSVFQQGNKNKETLDENSIIKLKQALKKLESPEKKKVNRKAELIETINKKRSKSTKVADLVREREVETQQCPRNSSAVFRISDGYCKYRSHRPSSFFQLRKCENNYPNLQIQNTNIKEVRKNRTLKNILQ